MAWIFTVNYKGILVLVFLFTFNAFCIVLRMNSIHLSYSNVLICFILKPPYVFSDETVYRNKSLSSVPNSNDYCSVSDLFDFSAFSC